jgi:hypothetical protein
VVTAPVHARIALAITGAAPGVVSLALTPAKGTPGAGWWWLPPARTCGPSAGIA